MNKPLIVAELGINHQGSLDIAKKLIDMAKGAGVSYVKFQKRTPTVSTPKELWNVPKETPWGTTETYLSYRQKIEFGRSDFDAIDLYCKQLGIKWFASVWDVESLDFMCSNYNLPFIKIPSAKLTNLELLLSARNRFAPTILSTGMSTLQEIIQAVDTIHREDTILLHCHSSYPSPEVEQSLSIINMLRNRFKLSVGFSSHFPSPFVPLAAVSRYNAEMIEVHVTLDRSMLGSDHAASLEPKGLELLVREIRRLDVIGGDEIKRVWESEIPIRKKLRGE